MTNITLFSLTTQYLMLQCFAPLVCYSFFYFPKWNKKGKRYNKIKTLDHSERQNIGSSTYVDGFTVNTTVKS